MISILNIFKHVFRSLNLLKIKGGSLVFYSYNIVYLFFKYEFQQVFAVIKPLEIIKTFVKVNYYISNDI